MLHFLFGERPLLQTREDVPTSPRLPHICQSPSLWVLGWDWARPGSMAQWWWAGILYMAVLAETWDWVKAILYLYQMVTWTPLGR